MNQAAVPASGGSVAGKTGDNIIDGNGQNLQRVGPISDRGSLLVTTVTDKKNEKACDQASSVSSIYRLLQRPDDSATSSTTATTTTATITPPPSNRPEPASATLVTGGENGSILVLPSLANSTTGYYRTSAASTGGETSSNNNSSGDENNSVPPPLPVKATRLYSLPVALNGNTVNVPIQNGMNAMNSMNSLPAIRHTLLHLPRGSTSVSSGVSSQTTYPPPAPLRSFQLQPQIQAQSQSQSQSQMALSGLKSLISNRPSSFNELMTTDIQDSRQQHLITTKTTSTATTTTNTTPTVPTSPTLPPRTSSQSTDSDYFHRNTPPKKVTRTHPHTKPTSQTATTTTTTTVAVSRRNAQELTAKSIAIKYIDRPISEYAQIVRAAEQAVTKTESTHTPKAHIQAAEQTRERERQVYALLWLMKHCEAKHDSYVPRGRIYALYAASCSTFGLRPLSQASLGKLIRILFPDLTTRRLGTRGQSKYHYCGLRLVSADDDNDNDNSNDVESRSSGAEACGCSGSSVTTPDAGSPCKNTGVSMCKEKRLFSGHPNDEEESLDRQNKKRLKLSNGSSGNDLNEIALTADNECKNVGGSECNSKGRTTEAVTSSCKCEFPFLANLLTEIFQNESVLATDYKLELPCVPRDIKIVGDKQLSARELEDSLTALELQYHKYQNRLFKSIISLDLESLSDTLASFSWQESVSPQVINTLFESSEFTDWIQRCDMVTYTSSIKYLSNLVVSDKLSSLSCGSPLPSLESFIQGFQDRATKAISDLPQPLSKLKAMKLQTLRTFMALVKKLLKLAKFIMNFLNSFATFKDGMRNDWETIVNLDDILEMVVATARYKDIMPLIRDFMRLNIESLLQIDEDSKEPKKTQNQRPRDVSSFNSTVTKLLEYISSPQVRQWPAYIFIDSYVRFTNAMVGDISLKSSENLLPWLFYNNVTTQLITYSFEVTKFVT